MLHLASTTCATDPVRARTIFTSTLRPTFTAARVLSLTRPTVTQPNLRTATTFSETIIWNGACVQLITFTKLVPASIVQTMHGLALYLRTQVSLSWCSHRLSSGKFTSSLQLSPLLPALETRVPSLLLMKYGLLIKFSKMRSSISYSLLKPITLLITIKSGRKA
jgi:hypothetical protein